MSEPLVLSSAADGVVTITLNRPDKLNALTPPMFGELRAAVDAVGEDARCVVLRGAGRSFCAGHDLAAIAEGGDDHAEVERFAAQTVDALEDLPCPVVGVIHGHCLTGGLELALGCDLLIAAESAKFADSHGQWGLVPVWGMSVRLPERIGRSRAKELAFTSRRLSGADAAAIGLVDRAVPDEQLDAVADALVAEIAANSAGTNRIYKKLFAAQQDMGRDEALQHERGLPFGVPDDIAERMAAAAAR